MRPLRAVLALLILLCLCTPNHASGARPTRHYLNGRYGWTRVTQYDYGTVTASGARVFYGEVAADPSIQFGRHIVVPGLGRFVVLDRGGMVYGAHIDVYVPFYPYPGIRDWYQGVYWTR